jgi:hypothetical protein
MCFQPMYLGVIVIINHLVIGENASEDAVAPLEVQIVTGKLFVSGELLMLCVIWGIKVCFLLLYNTIT